MFDFDFLFIFVLTLAGVYIFRTIAISKGVISNPNFRSLHDAPKPSGAGIVFSSVFVGFIFFSELTSKFDISLVLVFAVGGAIASLFGLIDDKYDIRATIKLFFQLCLVTWVLFFFNGGTLTQILWVPTWISYLITGFLLLWLINLYNFVDGVDGMACSGAVFICLSLLLTLYIKESYFTNLHILLFILSISSFAFLLFNWPPASIFMGDSGSVFLGYIFGALIVYSTSTGQISIWTWLVVFGYFLGDTTTTSLIRMFMVKKWYGAHRSHAYQNLARIYGSHIKVTSGVLLYHLVWLLPLAIWSAQNSNGEPIAAILALTPSVLWTIKFGPFLSSS